MSNAKRTSTAASLQDAFVRAQTPAMVNAIDNGASEKAVYKLLRDGISPHTPDADGRLPVEAAMERSAYGIVKQLIAAGAAPPVYEGDPNGPPVYTGNNVTYREELARHTALTYFIEQGNNNRIIFTLICNGADVNLKNANGKSPLQAAVDRKWPYVATQLVKDGAWRNPEAPDIDEVVDTTTGATRLLAVILEGQNGLAVKKLLQDGADPNKPDDNGVTPLALARALDWEYVEKLLLEHDAKETPFPDGNQMCGANKSNPLLCYAASYQSCHTNYLHALLDAGADPNAQDESGKTALHWAAIFDKPWLFDMLVEEGADINATDTSGMKPLHYACMNDSLDIVLHILHVTNDADINTPVGNSGQTPLLLAAGRVGAYDLVEELVARGAYINQPDAHAEVPLGKAVETRDIPMVKLLIELGADTAKETLMERPAATGTQKIYRRNPPIFSLVHSNNDNNLALAQILLDTGVDPNTTAHESINGTHADDSLLYFAMRYRAYDLAKLLLQAGADPHGTAHNGESAMHHCLHLRQVEGVRILLQHGFDPLRHFDYTQTWSNGTEVRHEGSTLDEARKLSVQFGIDGEYGEMLKIIEQHIAAQDKPAPQKPKKSPAKPTGQ